MKFIPAIDLLKKAEKENYAVPAFTVWNAELIDIVLKTAEDMQSPVILLTGPSEFNLFSPKKISSIAYNIAENYTIPAALYLDHGSSLKEIRDCIEANYTGLMLDFSSKKYEENVKGMLDVIKLARPLGISVEGEIGSIGKADKITEENAGGSNLTEPEEAKRFVEETKIDMLAVGIGNAHGIYSSLPKLDFNRLQEIYERVQIPLVLHGGSGTPEKDLKRAVSLGICKVNVASELVKAIRDYLLSQWNAEKNLWIPIATAKALKKIPPIVKKWIQNLGSENKI